MIDPYWYPSCIAYHLYVVIWQIYEIVVMGTEA